MHLIILGITFLVLIIIYLRYGPNIIFNIALTVFGASAGVTLSNLLPGKLVASVEVRAFKNGQEQAMMSCTEQAIKKIQQPVIDAKADSICKSRLSEMKAAYAKDVAQTKSIMKTALNHYHAIEEIYKKAKFLSKQKSPGRRDIKEVNTFAKDRMILMHNDRESYSLISSSLNGPAKNLYNDFRETNEIDIYTLTSKLEAIMKQKESNLSNIERAIDQLGLQINKKN